jgi:D-alanyl-lipoteichoic acid acyltransferase DltB (MBOAT superfamily)
MLFNSFGFLFAFMPVTVIGFFVLARYSRALAAAWLFAASLFFYGWWNPVYLALLLASTGFNFVTGRALAQGGDVGSTRRRRLLALGVTANLALLGYFKYADFFIATTNALAGASLPLLHVVLPLGISFFTFTQIAFLVDAARGEAHEFNPVHYGLFVTYFPHLIAGPVLHHKEMMPQFNEPLTYVPRSSCFAVGLTVFAIGLFKKVVLADGVAPHAIRLFGAVEGGAAPQLLDAWAGALAYTLQLYFDFSGYSDMAIGLSYVFGIRLPINFNSPYKAANIAEFWRRWHMTLSRFLRDYLYIPLGGNRHGTPRRYANLLATMLLGGLWHGAGWTFVIWGGLHGVCLVVHQAWQAMRARLGGAVREPGRIEHFLATALTFLVVVVGWVFFRANSLDGALRMLAGMAGLNGVSLPAGIGLRLGQAGVWAAQAGVAFVNGGGAEFVRAWGWILALLPIVFLAPNSQQIMRRFAPSLDAHVDPADPGLAWRPGLMWAGAMAVVLALGLLSLTRPSEFLYFQF